MVFVDKATETIAAHDRPSGFCDGDWRSALGYSEVESAVGTFSVVVVDVGVQHGLEVAPAEDKDPVEALDANGPDETLGIGICPGGSPGGADDLHTLRFELFVKRFSESVVSIVDKEAQRRRSVLSCLGQVAGDLGTPLHVGRTVGNPA
jgi:hypothetical protein